MIAPINDRQVTSTVTDKPIFATVLIAKFLNDYAQVG